MLLLSCKHSFSFGLKYGSNIKGYTGIQAQDLQMVNSCTGVWANNLNILQSLNYELDMMEMTKMIYNQVYL